MLMSRIITDNDLKFLRETHFLSKNLTEYLQSILNIDKYPVKFSYNKTIGIKHRLKKKMKAARIFLEACKEAELYEQVNKDIKFKLVGDLFNMRTILGYFNCYKTYTRELMDSQPLITLPKIFEKEFETDFYFEQFFYKLRFSIIKLEGENPFKGFDKLIIVLGNNFEHDDFMVFIDKFGSKIKIPVVIFHASKLSSKMLNALKMIKSNVLMLEPNFFQDDKVMRELLEV